LINHKITYDAVIKKTPCPRCPSFEKSGGNATALRHRGRYRRGRLHCHSFVSEKHMNYKNIMRNFFKI